MGNQAIAIATPIATPITPTIIIDTREQRPYVFENSIKHKLEAGDYSLQGLEHQFAIERKSMDDYVNTIIHDRKRFNAELRKLQQYRFAIVLIEGSLSDILNHNYNSQAHPKAIFAITIKLMQQYHPIHFLFAGDRPHAHALVGELMVVMGEWLRVEESGREADRLLGAEREAKAKEVSND